MPTRDPLTGRFVSGADAARSVEVRGLIEAQRKMEQVIRDLRGEPMLQSMREATLVVQRSAKMLAPVDTGRLRASIIPEVRSDLLGTVIGVIGTNAAYGPPVELGSRPHWPPVGSLDVWAKRHGINAFVVMRAISRRGTKPRRFLQGAVEQNEARIVRIIGEGVAQIVAK